MVALIMVGDLRKRLSLIDVFRELFEVVLTFGVLANVFPVLRGKGLVALGRPSNRAEAALTRALDACAIGPALFARPILASELAV